LAVFLFQPLLYRLFLFLEKIINAPLPYEGAIRLYIIFAPSLFSADDGLASDGAALFMINEDKKIGSVPTKLS